MKLQGLEVAGIKGFTKSQRLDLSDINLIYGANSSGKSSLLQTILLLQQSSLRAFSAERGYLEFRGSSVDLGGFRTFVTAHDVSRTIEISLAVTDVEVRSAFNLGRNIAFELGFTLPDGESVDADLSRVMLKFDSGRISFVRGGDGALKLADAASAALVVDLYFTALGNAEPRARKSGSLPMPQEVDRRWLRDWLRNQSCDTQGWLPFWGVATVAGRRGRPVGGTKGSARNQLAEMLVIWWLNYIYELAFSLYEMLADIVYVGPLREFPRRVVTEATEGSGVGVRGERLVLHLARHDELVSAVNSAFLDLDIPYELKVDKFKAGKIEDALGDVAVAVLTDRRSGVVVSPADVGFGLSQVLPVVVQLVGNTDKTILIEQPEIHLHPKMQGRLADVILRSTRENRNRVIVETHSEHLLIRAERRIRESKGSIDPGVLAVFYVSAQDGGTAVRRLKVDQTGRVSEPWPDGFFDEKLEDLLA